MARGICIAIDGPAGAGKSTVARRIARELGLCYVDSGAMYRALTVSALQQSIDVGDEKSLTELASKVNIFLTTDPQEPTRVFIGGKDITALLRDPEVSRNVSLVSLVPGVREEMVKQQRKMAINGNIVMEGRDVGTVILPDAEFKFFLTASVEERARRRQAELAVEGRYVELSHLIREIQKRDEIDSSRQVAPLRPSLDAQVIDSTHMNIDQVVGFIVEQIRRRS